MRVSLKAVPGVETVNVSLANGLASVTLNPGNAATLKQLGEAIAKNGFSMKQSDATLDGQIVQVAGKTKIKLSGSNEMLDLVPDVSASAVTSAQIGKNVEVSGTIPEAAKGKTPDSIRYRTIAEKK